MFQINGQAPTHAIEPDAIEVRHADGWVPLHIHRARRILAAPVGPAPINTPDGALIKCHGTWSKETSERAEAAGAPGTAAWRAVLGPHEEAVLTVDGRLANTKEWCRCVTTWPAEAWVRYERWLQRGREAHGYVCPNCRRLTQAG